MLSWIKKRVRMYEAFDFAASSIPRTRATYISAAIEDYQWWIGSNLVGFQR